MVLETHQNGWLDQIDEQGMSPLTRAMKSGSLTLTQIVFEYEKCCTDPVHLPDIHRAALAGDDAAIDALLAQGVDPDLRDDACETPLHKACREGHYTTVLTLLSAGAIPNMRDGLGLAPLHWVVLKNNREIVELLYQFGGDVNIRDSFGAMTPFTYAKLLGYADLARLLARLGGTW